MRKRMRALVPLALLALAIYWWLQRRLEEQVPPARVEIKLSPRPVKDVKAPVPDDLKRIEGIGPKISVLLQKVGVKTFAKLAETGSERLRQILREGGLRANPTTWPQQASLAAAGDWDALGALQAELKGGRPAI